MAYGDNEILEILNHYEATMIDHISKLLIKYHSFTRVNDINNAAYLIYKSVEEVVHGTKVLDYPCDEESLLKELTDMICLYVLK
jgi:plasmid replication initiation protein